jgi:hypothetical protein
LRRAIHHAPNEKDSFAILAVAYAELDRVDEAKTAFETFREEWGGRMGWGGWPTLAKQVVAFPFSDATVLRRLASGFRVAGATLGVGGHLPLHADNRLNGFEIEALLLGKEIKGIEFWREKPWRQRRTLAGRVEHRGTSIHLDVSDGDVGSSQITNDMLCERWSGEDTNSERCVVLFRIKDPNARIRWGDYVMVTDTGPHPFRAVE